MALKATLTIDGNETVLLNAKNKRTGIDPIYTAYVYGDFGGGTVSVSLSPDGGTTDITAIDSGSAVNITSDEARNIIVNSDESNPVQIRFTMAGATNPDVTVKVYDNS